MEVEHPPLHRRHAPPLYGVMAEFESPNDLVAAARKVYSLGYRRINGYSPYPIEELSEAIGFTHTRLPLIVYPDRLGLAARDAKNRNFRRVDNRREPGAADAAERRDREHRAADVLRPELAGPRLARQLAQLGGDLQEPLLVDVADDRDDQAVGRVGREAEMPLRLDHELLAVQRRGEARERVERRAARLQQQGDHRHLDVGLLGVELLAERLELGDVRLVVVGDVRDHHPVAGQVRAADPLDPRELDPLGLAVLGEIGRRPGRDLEPGQHVVTEVGIVEPLGSRRRWGRPGSDPADGAAHLIESIVAERKCSLPDETFTFLGFTFGRQTSWKTGRAYVAPAPSTKKVQLICDKISLATRRQTTLRSEQEQVVKLNQMLVGWANYFQLGYVTAAWQIVQQHGGRDEAREADADERDGEARPVDDSAALDGREGANRRARDHADRQREQPERDRHGQRAGEDVVDRPLPVLHGPPEVALGDDVPRVPREELPRVVGVEAALERLDDARGEGRVVR